MERGLVVPLLADVVALVQRGVQQVALRVAAADELVLQSGVEIDEVPRVLPRVVHHVRREGPAVKHGVMSEEDSLPVLT